MDKTNPRYRHYREAVALSRYWWNRYESLPRWRWVAKRKAYEQAQLWAQVAEAITRKIANES